jgi:hypothetical protein
MSDRFINRFQDIDCLSRPRRPHRTSESEMILSGTYAAKVAAELDVIIAEERAAAEAEEKRLREHRERMALLASLTPEERRERYNALASARLKARRHEARLAQGRKAGQYGRPAHAFVFRGRREDGLKRLADELGLHTMILWRAIRDGHLNGEPITYIGRGAA